jgi:flagellin-like hook-associated protein FlgL
MNVNLNSQYAVLRSSAYDINRAARAQGRVVAQLSTGTQDAEFGSGFSQTSSLVNLRSSGLRLRTLESGVVNALSYLETQAQVYQKMSNVVGRMSQLASQMVDQTKETQETDAYLQEFLELSSELSSYRTETFNGRNLMNYLDDDSSVGGAKGTSKETLPVVVSEEGKASLKITQPEVRNGFGPYGYLLGLITPSTAPKADGTGLTTVDQVIDPTQWGQKGFQSVLEDLALHIARNQSEQSQLRLNLDHIREKSFNMDAATSRIGDVDVAGELSNLVKTDLQMRGAIATKTQSNVLADSALRLLSNTDFSSPFIREARLSAGSASSLFV